jgi:hypothetical protein
VRSTSRWRHDIRNSWLAAIRARTGHVVERHRRSAIRKSNPIGEQNFQRAIKVRRARSPGAESSGDCKPTDRERARTSIQRTWTRRVSLSVCRPAVPSSGSARGAPVRPDESERTLQAVQSSTTGRFRRLIELSLLKTLFVFIIWLSTSTPPISTIETNDLGRPSRERIVGGRRPIR